MRSFAHIAIFVSDLDRMERFYQDVFGMRMIWKKENDKAYLTTGNNDVFALLRHPKLLPKYFDLSIITKDPYETPNFPHFGVVVDSEPELLELFERIKNMKIPLVGPKTSRDRTKSFYFLDPENNPIQVVFPPQDLFL